MKRSAINTSSVPTLAILSVSPHGEDDGVLERIGRDYFASTGHQSCRLKLVASRTQEKAMSLLRRSQIPIAICERDCAWRELLEQTAAMSASPLVIVTSRLADERMWAEVLNLGGWDVLAKPFDRTEVIRVIESAWLHWNNLHPAPARKTELHAAGLSV